MTLECEDWEIYHLKCWRNHNYVYMKGKMLIWIYCTLFFFVQVLSHWILLARFLMRQLPYSYDHPRESVRKYENLSDYKNLWMIIYIDVHLFVTPYKRKIPLMKIYYILFLYSNFSFLFSSPFTLYFYNNFTNFNFIKKVIPIY